MIPEGTIDLESVVDQISAFLGPKGVNSNRCSAIFIHETHFPRLRQELVDRSQVSTKLDVPLKSPLQECERLTASICVANLSKILGDDLHSNFDLMMQAAQNEELLMLIQVTSFEQIVTSLERQSSVQAVTLLSNPSTPETLKHYFKDWIKAPILSIGDISSELPAGMLSKLLTQFPTGKSTARLTSCSF